MELDILGSKTLGCACAEVYPAQWVLPTFEMKVPSLDLTYRIRVDPHFSNANELTPLLCQTIDFEAIPILRDVYHVIQKSFIYNDSNGTMYVDIYCLRTSDSDKPHSRVGRSTYLSRLESSLKFGGRGRYYLYAFTIVHLLPNLTACP